jgi:hypothetical protein
MHTTIAPLGTCFNHNGDFSGLIKFSAPLSDGDGRHIDVEAPFSIIVQAASRPGHWTSIEARREDNDERSMVEVPIADLRTLVAKRVRDERIRALEEMEYDELFASALATEIPTWAAEIAEWD